MKKELFVSRLFVLAIFVLTMTVFGCADPNASNSDSSSEQSTIDSSSEVSFDEIATEIEAASQTRAKQLVIKKTIVVKKGKHRDFKNVTIICKGMGDGSQSEKQKPAIKLEKGASISNVTIGKPAVDGIHCYGNNKLKNVKIPDIGEDAFSVKGSKSKNVGTIEVSGGYANKGSDKVFQVNAPCTLKISNFKSDTMGKFVRQIGGSKFTCKIYLNNITLKNVKEAVVRTDSSSTRIYYRNLKVSNFKGKKGWWYGRDKQAKKY